MTRKAVAGIAAATSVGCFPRATLEHLGRMDSQVKLRGFRIELGEISAVLLGDPAVASAAAILVEPPHMEVGAEQIVVFVVLDEGCSTSHLRGVLMARLPAYMMPARIICLDQLPLTNNGKLDQEALPGCFAQARATREDAMDVESEDLVASTVLHSWRSVMGTDVGPGDNFFESGGNSLLAVKLASALRGAGFESITVRDLYLNPTPAAMSATLAVASQTAGR